MLTMNYTLLKSDYESLKRQNEELTDYKLKYESLQSDVQNNIISASVDSKQILMEFKEQNQRQLQLIEVLKTELERMKKENDVYRTFNNAQKRNNPGNSQAILQSLIDKSEKEYVNLKNLQLKKIERVQEEVKDEGPKKNEVVGEKSGNVS